MIRVYAVGGSRLAVLPHTTESDVRAEAVALARDTHHDRVLVIDRAPDGEEAVVEELVVAPEARAGV